MKNLSVYIAIVLAITFPYLGYAQETDSIPHNKTGEIVGIAIPAAAIIYGAISLGDNGIRQLDYSVRDNLVERNALWHVKWDDYLQFSPAVAAFGMKLGGVQSTHKLLDMAILYALSNGVNGVVVEASKFIVGRERPDQSDHFSFPSGHTSTAFVAAEFLHQEYKDQSVWISVGGYSMATLIGVARVYNNKHWVSDVVTGAGVGILSTKAVYWVYPYLQKIVGVGTKNKKTSAILLPDYEQGNWGVSLSCSF